MVTEQAATTNWTNAPKFLSLEFHTRYFPAMLLARLRSGGREETGFSSTLEHNIALAVCFMLLVLGLPGAASGGSILGWVLASIGAAGMVALLINSISARRGIPPSFDEFLIGIFVFFVFLGMTCGVFVGTLAHSLLLGLVCGFVGLGAGYLLGILCGLWFQYLGWISAILNMLAGLAVVGMLVLDIVLLSGT